MANQSFKKLSLGLLALSMALFVGCMGQDAVGSKDEYGSLSVKVGTGDVNAASKNGLGKGATISLSKMIVTLVSNSSNPTANDTIRDTIIAGLEQGFVSTSTADQTIDSVYVLKALRTWYITVETRDTRDSLIHTTTDSIVKLLAGENRSKSLSLNPRFVMYKANFNFPDSLATLATSFKQVLNVKRLIMKVNNKTVAVDSTTNFVPNTPYSIGFDYVPVDSGTTVDLFVVGNLGPNSFAGDSVLYRKTAISIAGRGPGQDGTHTDTLFYVGPVTGANNLSVTIVKVGLVNFNITTPQVVVPKQVSK